MHCLSISVMVRHRCRRCRRSTATGFFAWRSLVAPLSLFSPPSSSSIFCAIVFFIAGIRFVAVGFDVIESLSSTPPPVSLGSLSRRLDRLLLRLPWRDALLAASSSPSPPPLSRECDRDRCRRRSCLRRGEGEGRDRLVAAVFFFSFTGWSGPLRAVDVAVDVFFVCWPFPVKRRINWGIR